MEQVMRSLKTENSELTIAFFRSDNAECYHNSTMLAGCCSVGAATRITLSRVDLSDPQGGKDPCNCKAATINAHVGRFINDGYNVQTVEGLETAMLSAGGLTGIRVALVDLLGIKENSIKWDGISLINNLQYMDTTITVWWSYNVAEKQ